MRWSGESEETVAAPAARRRSVSHRGKSSGASGMRKLSPKGEAAAEPDVPVFVSHSRTAPVRRHAAAFVGAAETKNCCQALERLTVNALSQTRFVSVAGQSAAKASNSFQETRPFVEITFAAATGFVGSMPARILAARVKPVPSRSAAESMAFVPPNQKSS